MQPQRFRMGGDDVREAIREQWIFLNSSARKKII